MNEAVRPLRLQGSGPGAGALGRMLIDPTTAVTVLAGSAWLFQSRFEAEVVILALLVFSLTFPGRSATGAGGGLGRLCADVFLDWGVLVAVLLLLGWTTNTLGAFDSRMVLTWVAVTPCALLAAHLTVPMLLARVLATDVAQRSAVIAGANEMGRLLAERITSNPFYGIRFVGYFDDRGTERLTDDTAGAVLGSLQELAEFVKSHHVNVIYCTLPMCSQPRITRLLEELHDTTASIYFVPDMLLFDLIQARVDSVGGIPVVAMCESPYYGVNALIKRVSDLILAAGILTVISPLMVLIAIAVKCSSPGPILFKQRRYGVDGGEIVVYKFRTMTCLEDGDVIKQARRDDPRVTRVGAVLRRHSLDELPQFLNVLQGRMSVVGPRPHAVSHNELYRKLIRGYMMRHKVKPGITGLAQVNGLRGPTESLERMRARIELDLEYLRNWSLLLDLKIVLLTVGAVLRNDNAY